MQFGRRSERLDPDQFNLALEDLEQAITEGEAEQERADPALRQARLEKRRVGRGPLPDHLPRVEIVIEPEIGRAVLRRRDARDRRRLLAAARRHPGAVPGHRHPPAEIRLSNLQLVEDGVRNAGFFGVAASLGSFAPIMPNLSARNS